MPGTSVFTVPDAVTATASPVTAAADTPDIVSTALPRSTVMLAAHVIAGPVVFHGLAGSGSVGSQPLQGLFKSIHAADGLPSGPGSGLS